MTMSADATATEPNPVPGEWPTTFRDAFEAMLLARANHAAGGPRPLVLGGYPAKKCARVTHNTWDPTVPPPAEPDLALQARFDLGVAFETEIVDVLADRFAATGIDMVRIPAPSLGAPDGTATQIRATLDAMASGAAVIAGGRLPDVDGRTGLPDLLLRVDTAHAATAPYAYVPGDIKAHKIVGKDHGPRKTHQASTLTDPTTRVAVPGYSLNGSYRKDDGMQLAHYTRMLEALGAHPGPDWHTGFILGTNDYTGWISHAPTESVCFAWIDLTDPCLTVWAEPVAGEPAAEKISVLAHYDREFAFRTQVAQVAQAQGSPGAPLPLVFPVGKSDCGECGYAEWCRENARPEDAASWALKKGKLSDREWALLTEHGYGTVESLAKAPAGAVGGNPADQGFLAAYRCAAKPLPAPDKRISEAVRRARLILDGVLLEWTGARDMSEDIAPRDIEIDFDIEWDPTGHIYLWGVRLILNFRALLGLHSEFGACPVCEDDPHLESHAPGSAFETYVPMHDLDAAETLPLLERVAAFFDEQITLAERYGLSLGIYHWSHPERSQVGKIDPDLRDRLTPYMVDLRKTVEGAFFDRDGTSVKTIAPAFGFTWRHDDAGGAMSQVHYETARSGAPEARAAAFEWLCVYNGDDCESTAAIRRGLRAHVPGADLTDQMRAAALSASGPASV